jgi:hypothetical protein
MQNTLKTIWIAAIMATSIVSTSNAGTWTTFNPPGAIITSLYDIDGSNIVGEYCDASGWNSFIYNGTTRTTLNLSSHLVPYGVSNNLVVGTALGVHDCGFLYDYVGNKFTYFSMPGGTDTWAHRINGNNIVGNYYANNICHGFLYDGKNWTTIYFPGADGSVATAIYDGSIVGYYSLPNSNDGYRHSFIYDGSTWTTLNAPNAAYTVVTDISERGIVGSYWNLNTDVSHGFLYDGSTWTTLDVLGAIRTEAAGISGNYIVGNYYDKNFIWRGFVYEIPEPASALLTGAGFFFARLRRRQS